MSMEDKFNSFTLNRSWVDKKWIKKEKKLFLI